MDRKGFYIMAQAVLSNGVNRLELTIGEDEGCVTLQDVLDLYRDSLNIPADATISRNGEPVDEDFDDVELEDGDNIVATKVTGSKG